MTRRSLLFWKNPCSLVNYSSSVNAAKAIIFKVALFISLSFIVQYTSNKHEPLGTILFWVLFFLLILRYKASKINPFKSQLNFVCSPWFVLSRVLQCHLKKIFLQHQLTLQNITMYTEATTLLQTSQKDLKKTTLKNRNTFPKSETNNRINYKNLINIRR